MESLTARFTREVFAPYLELLKAEHRFHPAFAHAKQMWEEKLTMDALVNGPFLEKSQMYAPSASLDALPLRAETKATIRQRLKGHNLYQHQTEAVRLILDEQNAVIATGTSSGKTLCYQIPILDDLLRDPSPGLRAVIIYPLNALVNDQLEEWETMLRDHPRVTFARFTGQTPNNQIDYENRLKDIISAELEDQPLREQEREREVQRLLAERKRKDPPNRLNHREAIRNQPPHILVTNFSMLEYLLERPVDAPVFENARLKFLVLDEVHAYRGVQATEIAFLVRRLKDRLGVRNLVSIATSATLGDPKQPDSRVKVRRFVSDLFDGEFAEPNPINGEQAQPELLQPTLRPTPMQYLAAAEAVRHSADDAAFILAQTGAPLGDLLRHDENLYRLRILTQPVKLEDAARQLWPDEENAAEALAALLEVVAAAPDAADLLPTRLHYFVRAQDGLHVCLHPQCPGRRDGKAAFFVSRQHADTPEGHCPPCWKENQVALLVEVVSCRKCGYLFGALQDLGPRRAQNPDVDENAPEPAFDSFSNELGWAADAFWSYFSVAGDLPYPSQPGADEDVEELGNLFHQPQKVNWCAQCGKKHEASRSGDNCQCDDPPLRELQIFHRQCLHKGTKEDLYEQRKNLLKACPNCGARNASGLEPVRRFQESDDETGLAMAVPLAHFAVTPKPDAKPTRKLLCFTDHRQRAAAFPALLEEETFSRDFGRKIVQVLEQAGQPLDFVALGERLADIADTQSDAHDPEFFLPTSRYPDDNLSLKAKANLWVAEVFGYFGIPDAARESAEDWGLVAVEYELKESEIRAFHELLPAGRLNLAEARAALQTLLGFARQRKAFTLPRGRVLPDDVAFGRVTADIGFALERAGQKNTVGWLPRQNQDGSYRDNFLTDYLRRLLRLNPAETRDLAQRMWDFLGDCSLLLEKGGKWRLGHERLFVHRASNSYACERCGIVTAYSACGVCPRKGCVGALQLKLFDAAQANIVGRWVAGAETFTTLKSEEHTAQINKDLAKRIEDEFRAEGVNLLSSTTTFEMGINIGDLQKVLLRNAPPNSASYVQRVGRAGRGADKNAVCVTLCKRNKYDADAWREPGPRLMSGQIRPPRVFTENRIIAQRHFNAVAFAGFLRQKIRDERLLRGVEQKTILAPFIAPEARAGIPLDWLKLPTPDLCLDFSAWLTEQTEAEMFQTSAKKDLLAALGGFDAAAEAAQAAYCGTGADHPGVMSGIAEDLLTLVKEMDRLAKERNYSGATEFERSVKNLLHSDVIAVLAKRGFLPRYAFPLDVVALETGISRWANDSDVTLSRDRAIAIAEFAPGAQVIARKRIFTSAGLYVMSKADRPERRWYAKCRDCGQIRTARVQEELLDSCPICQHTASARDVYPFVEPQAFSIEIERTGARGERHRRTSLVRQRQSATHFIDYVEDSAFTDWGLFRVALKPNGKLFRYNRGPQQKGFVVCHVCGRSEPDTGRAMRRHKRLRPLGREEYCHNENLWKKPVAFGHQFESFCLIVRPFQPVPVHQSISLAYALQRGACRVLELDTSDIGVSGRGVTGYSGGNEKEIVLFDKTPGGAGFVRDAFDQWEEVVEQTTQVCRQCSCEKACYDCLKDYYNQSAHEYMRRKQAVEFLTSLRNGGAL